MEWLDHILLPDSEVRDEMDFVKKEIKIPAKIHKTLIGVGGKLIQTIMNKCGEVQIKFPESNSGSDVVTVCGPTDSVEKAVKLLKEMSEEKQLSGDTVESSDMGDNEFGEDGSGANAVEEEEVSATRFSDIVNNASLLLNNLDAMKGKEPYKQIQIASGGLVILRPSPSSQQSHPPDDTVSVNMDIDSLGSPDEVPMEVGDVQGDPEVNNNDLFKENQAGRDEEPQQGDQGHEQATPQPDVDSLQDAGGGQEQEVNNNESRRPRSRKKYTAPSAGGQKRALLLACADNVPESRSVLNSFLEALQIWTIQEEMIIVGDCKIINLLMGTFI